MLHVSVGRSIRRHSLQLHVLDNAAPVPEASQFIVRAATTSCQVSYKSSAIGDSFSITCSTVHNLKYHFEGAESNSNPLCGDFSYPFSNAISECFTLGLLCYVWQSKVERRLYHGYFFYSAFSRPRFLPTECPRTYRTPCTVREYVRTYVQHVCMSV